MFRKTFISFTFILFSLASVWAVGTENSSAPSEEKPSQALPIIRGNILPGLDIKSGDDSAELLINGFFQKLTTFLIGQVTAVAVVFLVIGGYQYLTSFGNEEQIKTAHKTIAFSLIGIALALLAFAIVQIVVNIKLENPDEPGLSLNEPKPLITVENDAMKNFEKNIVKII